MWLTGLFFNRTRVTEGHFISGTLRGIESSRCCGRVSETVQRSRIVSGRVKAVCRSCLDVSRTWSRGTSGLAPPTACAKLQCRGLRGRIFAFRIN